MTMIRDFDEKCSVCGKSSPQLVLTSTNTMGYPDLDLRPPEMQRSTMNTWIHECPHCGYVGVKLEDETDISMDFLTTEEYLTCDGHDFESELSRLFYRWYLIGKKQYDSLMCLLALRNCAWKCDDYGDENASDIRKLAIGYLDELILMDGEDKNSFLLIRADFLRRSGQFERLLEEYENITIGEEIVDDVIRFQLERAAEDDTACYTVEDVVNKDSSGH